MSLAPPATAAGRRRFGAAPSVEQCTILTIPTGRDLDLTRQQAIERYLSTDTKPDAVIVAAAKVGGIVANDTFPGRLSLGRSIIAQNLINASHPARAWRKVVVPRFIVRLPKAHATADRGGDAAEWPARANQPMVCDREDCWDQIMPGVSAPIRRRLHRRTPTNLYGPGDNDNPEHSHVPAALMPDSRRLSSRPSRP